MSDSLSLSDHLLTRGRLMAGLGHRAEARRILTQLLAQHNLSKSVRAEAHQLLAGIELAAGRFRRARRQIVAAIRLRRHADELYIEYARIVDADPDGDARQAVKALRQAVGIDPFEIHSWAMLGRMAVRAGDPRLARKALDRAASLRPDAAVLAVVVDGYVALGMVGEARKVLAAARFRSPRDAGVLAEQRRFQFDQVAGQQRSRRKDLEMTILPFPETTSVPAEVDDTTPVLLRADRHSRSVPHLLRMFGLRSGPRQAQ